MRADIDHEGRLFLYPQTLTEEVSLLNWRSQQLQLVDAMSGITPLEAAVFRELIDKRIVFGLAPGSDGPKHQSTASRI